MQKDEQIKHMTERFLRWELPADFNPDAGISFDPVYNLGTEHQGRHEPTGTNLLSYTQAEAMVRHMVDGISALTAAAPAMQKDELALVEQIDRESAADMMERWECEDRAPYVSGEFDQGEIVQAFARHRLSALTAAPDAGDGLVGRFDRALEKSGREIGDGGLVYSYAQVMRAFLAAMPADRLSFAEGVENIAAILEYHDSGGHEGSGDDATLAAARNELAALVRALANGRG